MKTTFTYNLKGARPLTYWKCDKQDPYEAWYPDVRVAVQMVPCCSSRQLQKFRQYCVRRPGRWGCYYDLIQAETLSFDQQSVATCFKLYGKHPSLGIPMDLVKELCDVLETKQTRGGPSWIATMKKKLGLVTS